MTPTIWVTPNKNSQVVCSVVHRATGFPMKQAHDAPSSLGPSIVYGLLRGCSEIIQRCEASKTHYWHIDHGYFRRSAPERFDGYYRITKNNVALRPAIESDSDDHSRWRALELEMAPLRASGGPCLVCPPTIVIAAHFRIDVKEWTNYWCGEAQRSGRQSIVRMKGDAQPLAEALAGVGRLVTFNSNVAVDAMVAGVPALHDLGPVKDYVPRERTAAWLANNQWKLDEIRPEIFQ